MIQNLFNLPKQAIFVLLNERDKKVYLSYSSRLPQKLGSIVSEMSGGTWRYKEMIKHKKRLRLVIIETNIQKNFIQYYKNEYLKKGYELYNAKEKAPLLYEFKIIYTQRKVLVVAVNTRNDKTILGRFNTYEEARGFLLYIQHNNPTNSLCYATNGGRL